MSKGQRNHYVPEFYLKQWGDPQKGGRLAEYCRRYKGVEARSTYPGGTGYAHGLYTFSDLPQAAATFLEDHFFRRSDDAAHAILQELLQDRVNLDADKRSAWSRFIMTLFHRSPEGVARIRQRVLDGYPVQLERMREQYPTLRHPGDPATFDDFLTTVTDATFQELTLRVLQQSMDSRTIGNHINNLQWGVIRVHRLDYTLLTSDRPIVMSNGMIHPRSHIVMPISPDRVFVATDTLQTMQDIHAIFQNAKKPVEVLNDRVVRQARKFVWARDAQQLRFVQNRLGEKARWSSFE